MVTFLTHFFYEDCPYNNNEKKIIFRTDIELLCNIKTHQPNFTKAHPNKKKIIVEHTL